MTDPKPRRSGGALDFRVVDPKRTSVSVPVHYTGIVPDPFAAGRGVLVTVQKQGDTFVGQPNSLTTKCPSKYQVAAPARPTSSSRASAAY
jgi:cytochrome c-type biogenesis protein CcmE